MIEKKDEKSELKSKPEIENCVNGNRMITMKMAKFNNWMYFETIERDEKHRHHHSAQHNQTIVILIHRDCYSMYTFTSITFDKMRNNSLLFFRERICVIYFCDRKTKANGSW